MNCQFSMNNEIMIRVKLYLCDIISKCVRHMTISTIFLHLYYSSENIICIEVVF